MMYGNFLNNMMAWSWGNMMPFLWWFPLAIVWSLAWKGVALWRAGRMNQLGWFVAILVINTFGLLEIFYLLAYHYKPPKSRR